MAIIPPIQATLSLVSLIASLIDLKDFSTILVLYDHTTRDQINLLIETLPTRNDVAWVLVNKFDNSEYLTNTNNFHQNQLILTALQSKNIYSTLKRLYDNKNLKRSSKNLIVLSEGYEFVSRMLSRLLRNYINAVLVDWTHDEVVIYAWNPYSAVQLIRLNETEFLWASNTNLNRGKYTGLFFHQLQSKQGRTSTVLTAHEGANIYNVVSKDSKVNSIDGADIKLLDLIGNAIQSPTEFLVLRLSTLQYTTAAQNRFESLFERNYSTFTPIQRYKIQYVTLDR